MTKLFSASLLVAVWGLTTLSASGQESAAVQKFDSDPAGSGKFYMGREIARARGERDIVWLERPEREREEQPAALMAALQLKSGEIVVDFGAGSGFYTFRLARAVGARGTVLAADIEPKMLAHIRRRAARENLTNVGLVQSTASDPRLPLGRIDLALLVGVYHQLEFPLDVMRKIRSALKPGGRLVVVEHRQEDAGVPLEKERKMSEAQLITEMSAAGFVHVETIGALPSQHIVVFGKTWNQDRP